MLDLYWHHCWHVYFHIFTRIKRNSNLALTSARQHVSESWLHVCMCSFKTGSNYTVNTIQTHTHLYAPGWKHWAGGWLHQYGQCYINVCVCVFPSRVSRVDTHHSRAGLPSWRKWTTSGHGNFYPFHLMGAIRGWKMSTWFEETPWVRMKKHKGPVQPGVLSPTGSPTHTHTNSCGDVFHMENDLTLK